MPDERLLLDALLVLERGIGSGTKTSTRMAAHRIAEHTLGLDGHEDDYDIAVGEDDERDWSRCVAKCLTCGWTSGEPDEFDVARRAYRLHVVGPVSSLVYDLQVEMGDALDDEMDRVILHGDGLGLGEPVQQDGDNLVAPVQFADQVTVPRVSLEEGAVSPFDVIREIQRRAAVIERPVTYPRHVTPPGHPPHRFEVLPLSRIETLALPEQPRGRAGRKARRACRKRGGHFWHPADAMIEWGCCVCGHRRDGMPKDGT